MNPATIAAISTPPGKGGIGIIKISGPDAIAYSGQIFRKSGIKREDQCPYLLSKSHQLLHGHIVDPDKNSVVDEVLVSVMLGPRSYTGEDVVEINAHSGPAVLATILELVISRGATIASPGEFTKRAFLNGRIDLTQAEGVAEMIDAGSRQAAKNAAAFIDGDLRRTIEKIRGRTTELYVQTEAALDFPDEVDFSISAQSTIEVLKAKVLAPVEALIENYSAGRIYIDGVRLIIVGKPNVGKSSLINRLTKTERVIVSPIPGTTRDFIEEALSINGVPFVVADTAGLHQTHDPIEIIGMQKTCEQLEKSDLILFVIDAGSPVDRDDLEIFSRIQNRNLIVVLNKSDLLSGNKEFRLPDPLCKSIIVKISARYDTDILPLENAIYDRVVSSGAVEVENRIIPNLRQKMALERARTLISHAIEGLQGNAPDELIAIDLKEIGDILGQILGIAFDEDLLGRIFQRFCIGK